MDDSYKNQVRITKGSRLLQAKVGKGTIDKEKIQESQEMIDKVSETVDFVPLANQQLDALKKAIENGHQDLSDVPLENFTKPVMQLKANASMFNYMMVGELTNVMLNFLETVEELDRDVLEIVGAHYKTLRHIIDNKISGTGGQQGEDLKDELKQACRRYFAKQAGA